MSSTPSLPQAVAWTNQPITLYHGTSDVSADIILLSGIDVSKGRPYKDFGPGFYTTTLFRQAQYWAVNVAEAARQAGTTSAQPAVVELIVARELLQSLSTLSFIRGDHDAEDFWSFVTYCRQGALDHALPARTPGSGKRYDVVYGPVAADWRQRGLFSGADQISFHTQAAQAFLNLGVRRRIQ